MTCQSLRGSLLITGIETDFRFVLIAVYIIVCQELCEIQIKMFAVGKIVSQTFFYETGLKDLLNISPKSLARKRLVCLLFS